VKPAGVNAQPHLYSGLAPLGMRAPLRASKSFLEILEGSLDVLAEEAS
jgi:hypothetical protein